MHNYILLLILPESITVSRAQHSSHNFHWCNIVMIHSTW